MTDPDLDYLRGCIGAAPFAPHPWDGEDRNLAAFRSKEELTAWYCQPPGQQGEPYRDRGFYCRELASLSRVVRPRTIVEFGTSLGIGTCLLRWLNPDAKLVSVDVCNETFLPGDRRVPTGYLADYQGVEYLAVRGRSQDYCCPSVDLCFVDADHSYGAVLADSERAWQNRAQDHRWAIIWHDHNGRHPGVLRAVAEFCAATVNTLQSRPDSDTVWIQGER